MGRKEVEFEVERRREDKTPVRDVDLAKNTEEKDTKKDAKKDSTPAEPENWLESPRVVENMRYFVFAQSFVIFLTFGLPKLQQAWALIVDYFS